MSSHDFQVLDALDSNKIITQRQLAKHTGISLGQINYVLRRLVEKGLIKVKKFQKNPSKIGYAYLLTPRGIEEKSKLAVGLVLRQLTEYHRLQERIAMRLKAIDHSSKKRIVLIGPKMACGFVNTVIKTRGLDLTIVCCLEDPAPLADISHTRFDAVALFSEKREAAAKVLAEAGIPENKILRFWQKAKDPPCTARSRCSLKAPKRAVPAGCRLLGEANWMGDPMLSNG